MPKKFGNYLFSFRGADLPAEALAKAGMPRKTLPPTERKTQKRPRLGQGIFGDQDEGEQFTAGSRTAKDKVPNLNFNDDKVNLNANHPENRNPNLGVRRVVSKIYSDSGSNRPTFCRLLARSLGVPNSFYLLKVSYHYKFLKEL